MLYYCTLVGYSLDVTLAGSILYLVWRLILSRNKQWTLKCNFDSLCTNACIAHSDVDCQYVLCMYALYEGFKFGYCREISMAEHGRITAV